jgi:hypothetical protein
MPRGFEKVFSTFGGIPWTGANIHALSGIRTQDPNIQAIKTHALDCEVTVNGSAMALDFNNIIESLILP